MTIDLTPAFLGPGTTTSAGTVECGIDPGPARGTATSQHQPMSEWFYDSPHVLVVDDDADTRDLVSVVLQREGLTVLQAASADEALSTIKDRQVAAVILDVVMPGLDGHTLCRQLKDSPQTHGVPIIMLTGRDTLTDEVESVLSGASAHLTKPVSPAQLVSRVRDLL